jgi:MerR family transcriptional regulator, thiopeptide resistance regulator
MSLTVTRLAQSCNLARSTVLYYESIGLLMRPRRSAGNYRVYSEKDLDRLRQICTYRDAGLTLTDIRSLLDAPGGNAAAVLRRRLTELSAGIERMREHQRAIARLLQTTGQFRRLPVVTKEKFTAILRASGFSEEDMRRLHTEFENSAPNEHQEFLEFLHIPEEEIRSIREWSRAKS